MAGLKAITQYEQVRKKVEDGTSVGQAIREVATSLGVSPGTVHTSYYRVGRKTGVLRGKTRFNGAANGTSTNGTSTADLMKTMLDAAEAIALRVESMERREAKLRQIESTLAEAS